MEKIKISIKFIFFTKILSKYSNTVRLFIEGDRLDVKIITHADNAKNKIIVI
tara:strand:+ start:2850 stop:3005 length:156 start_codon:yes stop_codon:yes gene_type:complete